MDEPQRSGKPRKGKWLLYVVPLIIVVFALGAWKVYKSRAQGQSGERAHSGIATVLGTLGAVTQPVFLPSSDQVESTPAPIVPKGIDCGSGKVKVQLLNTSDTAVGVDALSDIEVRVKQEKAECSWSGPLSAGGTAICTTSIAVRPREFIEVKIRYGAFEQGLSGECLGFAQAQESETTRPVATSPAPERTVASPATPKVVLEDIACYEQPPFLEIRFRNMTQNPIPQADLDLIAVTVNGRPVFCSWSGSLGPSRTFSCSSDAPSPGGIFVISERGAFDVRAEYQSLKTALRGDCVRQESYEIEPR